ncbi:MAG TPA: hypothetical protein VI818_03715, partial [Candidatus Thermoplasmatota archaeon]|nr:hypothetical protein [Candidatus Thermoplasmatota archaeon]
MAMARKERSRGELIRTLWPDKAMYGAIMLFITGVVGLGYGFINLTFDVEYSTKIPALIRNYPDGLTMFLSAVTVACSYLSLRFRDTKWAVYGCIAGILAIGLVAVGSALSVIALIFIVLSRLEKEDRTPETLRLTTDMWPDKSLAASLLMLITGITTLAWSAALLTGTVVMSIAKINVFGFTGLLVGLMCLFAALELYFQRGLWVGAIAAIGGMCTLAFYMVGPLLSGATLVLIILA